MSSLPINSPTLVSRTKSAAVSAFLSKVLADGEVEVLVLEERARAAGLLSEQQRIGSSKVFKGCKRRLQIESRREGFGRTGKWFWRLQTQPEVKAQSPATLSHSNSGIEAMVAGDSPSEQPTDRSAHESVETIDFPAQWTDARTRLETHPAPSHVPKLQWRQLIDDYRYFLSSPEKWAARAYEFQWSLTDLLGCCRLRPFDYRGRCGLIWNLGGGRLQTLTRHSAVIVRAGREYPFDRLHRRALGTGATLPWLLS